MDNMLINCAQDSAGNEYFIVKTPGGLTYSLKQRKTILGKSLVKKFKAAGRKKLLYLVTDIEDNFGNKLSYHYQGNGLLEYIKHTPKNGSQETLISLFYVDNLISTITSFGKSWAYDYSSSSSLIKVVRPDSKYWQYQFPSHGGSSPDVILNPDNTKAAQACDYRFYSSAEPVMRVKHPDGALVEFEYALKLHGRTEVPANMMFSVSGDFPDPLYNINSCYGMLSIVSKKITLSENEEYQWAYSYTNNGLHWNIDDWNPNSWGTTAYAQTAYKTFNSNAIHGNQKSATCSQNAECSAVPADLGYHQYDLRVLTVQEPTGANIKYYISKRWDHTDGKVVATQWFEPNGDLHRTVKKTFKKGVYKGNSGIMDPIPNVNFIPISFGSDLTSSILLESNNIYSTIYDEYNEYGALLQSHSYNSFSATERHVKQTYQHDTDNWLLNLPRLKSTSPNGINWTTHQENTYYSATSSYKSLPYESKVMGRVATRNSQYHSDGNLKKVEYVGTGRYELFEDYKRGKARKVTLPCHKANACNTANGSTTNTVIAKLVVNNDGTIDQKTDFNGNSTNYDYNPMGWLTQIDPADSKWSNTTISYGVVAIANDGLTGSGAKVGQLKQTISQGNYQKVTYFDSMLRPYLVRTRDTSNAATTSYQRSEYDAENRVTFTSFPSSSILATSGTRSTYDALGRKVSDVRTTDNATTLYSYLSNNRMSVTDARNNTTTTTFLAYGSPSKSKATYIASPEGVNTAIDYNLFGQVSAITQGGITETRLYDSYQQLCKTVRPDTGVTAFGYNSARQMTWQAEGANGSTTACDTGQVPASQKTTFSYNNWGDISLENYPDGSPDKVYGYNENGQVESLTAGITAWSYDYNSLGMVEKQTLAIDSKSFVIDPEYNSLGHVKSLSYPSGRVVEFSPNALGQATKAGTYAYSAKYHANGSLDNFTYGNGLTSKRTLNSNQQPYELSVKQGSSYKSRHRYLYDNNSNVDYISDLTDSTYNIDLGYDDLDRLESASGKWGSGSFIYDQLGNLQSKNLGSQTLTYHYDTTKNRLSSVSGAEAYSFQYDARGNVANNGRFGLIFNRANQLTNAKGNAYSYDGYNRLVKKVSDGKNVYSVYGISGTLYYREDSQQKKTDYIRMGSELVAKDDGDVNTEPTPPPNNEPTTPPNAVNSLSGYGSGCCSFVTSWVHGSPSDVTYYELYKLENSGGSCPPRTICPASANNSFSMWTKAYSGNAKTFTVNSSSDYVDFKVRACNAIGCSADSSVKRVYSNSNNEF